MYLLWILLNRFCNRWGVIRQADTVHRSVKTLQGEPVSAVSPQWPYIVAQKFHHIGPSESAQIHPPLTPSSSAFVSWVTFYPCPSKLCRLRALTCLHSGSMSNKPCAAGSCAETAFGRCDPPCAPTLSWDSFVCSQKTWLLLCTQTSCALVAQITDLDACLTGTSTTGIWPVQDFWNPILVL